MQAGVDIVKRLQSVFIGTVLIFLSFCTSVVWAQPGRWAEQKANAWYAQQPWLVGSNYVPKSAINQLEMWQEATINPEEIEKEFTWAEAMGMNTMRVFLHDLLWQQDAAGFLQLAGILQEPGSLAQEIQPPCDLRGIHGAFRG